MKKDKKIHLRNGALKPRNLIMVQEAYIYEDHTSGMDYNLLTPKGSGKISRSTSFKPNENESREILNSAFKSRLPRLMQAYLKQGGSKSKNDNVKDVEQRRRKVPPGTFEALDDQYGAYWSVNTSFVQEEQIKSTVAISCQIALKDLPPKIRAVIIEKPNPAIVQYSNFAFDLDTIIPIEFQTDSRSVSLPSISIIPTSNDATYNDYKNLFSFTHLQVINTLNFGTIGVQSKAPTNHLLWGEIHKRTRSKVSSGQAENAVLQADEDDFDQQFQDFIVLSKSVNTTIKKSVVLHETKRDHC
ncbi:hypothetical protein G6F56_004303 [Rhizopus delemar]|nr:hypothetical protein G6F56_004303 [Rhizopus delemar]